MRGFGAVNFDYFNANKKLLNELKQNFYKGIFVVQEINYGMSFPVTKNSITSNIVLETLTEAPRIYIRGIFPLLERQSLKRGILYPSTD